MIAAVVIILAGFFLLSLKRPTASYGIILALLPTYLIRFKFVTIPTTFLELLVGVFLFAVLLTHWNKNSLAKILSIRDANWAIGILMVGVAIATAVSPEPTRALGQLKSFFIEPILLFYAGILVFKNKEQLLTPLKWLFGSVSVISLFGIVQYLTHVWLPLRFWGYGVEIKRITSVFEYPNALALFLAPLFIFFLTTYLKGLKPAGKYWTPIGLILMLTALTLTSSRGAWLAVMVAVVVLAFQKSNISLKKWGVVGVVVLLLASPLLFTRIKSTFKDASSSERIQLYKVAGDRILDNALLGNGLFGFRETLENSTYAGEILNYPHNIILNFWLETGLLGMLGFFLIVFFALTHYKRSSSAIKLAAALYLLTMIAHGMVDVPYFKNDLSILFWFMVSILYLEE